MSVEVFERCETTNIPALEPVMPVRQGVLRTVVALGQSWLGIVVGQETRGAHAPMRTDLRADIGLGAETQRADWQKYLR